MIILLYAVIDLYIYTESGEDYDGISAIVSFAACQRRACVMVNITDDEILENIESFNFTLERTSELDTNITLDPVDGVVQINDNDGIFRVCAECCILC